MIDSALNSGWKVFEDSIQHNCAIETKVDAIVTRNKPDYSASNIPVYLPVEFLEGIDKFN